jgi:hypothetical protein
MDWIGFAPGYGLGKEGWRLFRILENLNNKHNG